MKRGRERVTLHPANVSSLLGSSSEIGLPEAPATRRTASWFRDGVQRLGSIHQLFARYAPSP
jgi:hypothetical protein